MGAKRNACRYFIPRRRPDDDLFGSDIFFCCFITYQVMLVTCNKKEAGRGIFPAIDIEEIKHFIKHVPAADTSQIGKDGLTIMNTGVFADPGHQVFFYTHRIKQRKICATRDHFNFYRIISNIFP